MKDQYTQYDRNNVAAGHEATKQTSVIRPNILYPTLLNALGNVQGKSGIDVGCGSGDVTRMLAERGARITGLDASTDMVKIAREDERREPLGIDYLVVDIANPELVLEHCCDFGTASLVLHYAETERDLFTMLRNIRSMLPKSGGKLVALHLNPFMIELPLSRPHKSYEANGPLRNGQQIKVTLRGNTTFINIFWDAHTYERAACEAGFTECIWHPVQPSQEAIENHPEGHWDFYMQNPSEIILEARV